MKLREQSNGEADVFLLAEGSMAATNRVSRVAATLPESKSSARSHMSSAREPGDLDGARQVMVTSGHPRKGFGRTPGQQAGEESDALVVCARQRTGQEGSSPSGSRMRGTVSKGGGNASPAAGGRYGEA